MLQLLPANHKKITLHKVVPREPEFNNLRIVSSPHATAYRTIKPYKQHSTSHVIAMYAFSIFGLTKQPGINTQLFPEHFTCGHLMPGDQARVNDAIKMFHQVKEKYDVTRLGKLKLNKVSEYISEFNRDGEDEIIALSKTYKSEEILFVYNPSALEASERFIKLNNALKAGVKQMNVLYGYEHCGHINVTHTTVNAEKFAYVKLYLKPQHFVILKSL
jgi:hypothetical protein